jgi:hypothetical protein
MKRLINTIFTMKKCSSKVRMALSYMAGLFLLWEMLSEQSSIFTVILGI